MANFPHDLRTDLLRYLARQMPESEHLAFEERLLLDQEFSDAAAVCEQELIDAYATGSLLPQERSLMASWITSSPQRMQRVALASAFLRTRIRKAGPTPRTIALALAACLLAAVALYLAHGNQAQSGRPSSSASDSVQPAGTLQQPAPPAAGRKVEVLLLTAERVRGEQPAASYQIHPGAPIELQVLLPSGTSRTGLSVSITPGGGQDKPLVEQHNLQAESFDHQLYLKVDLTAGSLQPGAYRLTVSREDSSLVSAFTLRWAAKDETGNSKSSR